LRPDPHRFRPGPGRANFDRLCSALDAGAAVPHNFRMRAIRVHGFGGPEVMTVETVPDPTPGPGEVVVRLAAAGVNPVDTYIRSGPYANLPRLPYTPGMDGAGVVSAVGDPGGRFSVGDRVYVAGSISGSYADQALCAADQIHPLPSALDFAQGAALGVPYATALRAWDLAGVGPGDCVLVHGATGGVGIAAVQLGKMLGLRVIGTGGTEAGRALVLQQGAERVFDHADPGLGEQLREATAGAGVRAILEMRADLNLGRDLEWLAAGGSVVVVGSRGPVQINPRDAMRRDATVRGMMLGNCSPAQIADLHDRLRRAMDAGAARPVIGARYPLAQAAEAHGRVLAPGALGKVVLEP
jgi:NADPH2:quinone reductase